VLGGFPFPSPPTPHRDQILNHEQQQELVRGCIRPRFPQLLHNPGSIGISCHVKTQNLSPIMGHNKEAVQHAKGQRRDGEEVHCGNGLTVILEERQPVFAEIRSSGTSPSRDCGFREIEAELEQFAVNTRRSPNRILGNHTKDQGSNLFADGLTARFKQSRLLFCRLTEPATPGCARGQPGAAVPT